MNAIAAKIRRAIGVVGDPLLALMLVAFGFVSLATADDVEALRDPDPFAYVLAVALAAPLAVRRRWPLSVLGAFLLAMIAFDARGYPSVNVDFFGPIIALYTVATLYPLRTSALAGLAVAAAVGIAFLVEPNPTSTAGDWLTVVVFVVGTTFVGDSVGRRRAYAAALEARTNELEAARHELAQHAVTEERLRMARELHDVVAHTMTAIVVQSALAQRSIDTDRAQASSAISRIESVSREGLNELRSVLSVLRAEDDDSLQRFPAPRLSDIDSLAERIRASGLDLSIRKEGDLDRLPPVLELACFRIIQEALTNALRYAAGAHVNVLLRGDANEVTVEVIDDGCKPGLANREFAGAGKGLAGMEERATLLGGSFEAGSRPGGGFRVTARLPRGASI